jgi:hypothetical protein
MKASVPSIAVIYCALILFSSCATSKDSVLQPKNDAESSKEATSSSCYVILNSGSTQHYSTLKLVTGVLVTPHLLADNKIVIKAKDIKAYQDNKRYAVSQKLLATKKGSYVATETLPGFAVRILKGKLNVYCRKYYNGNNSVEEYFLQSGDDGEIVPYSTELMNQLVKDNPKASDYYNSKIKISPKSKKLLATADIYNSSQLISKN